MAADAAAAEPDAFSQFPAPPGFYRLYENGPDAGPEPPEPVKGEIHALGEPFDPDEPLVPPLDVPKLYSVQADGSVDIKGELMKLNRGLLFLFLELLSVLVQQPSQYAGVLTQILATLHNMTHLVNMARPLQAREALKFAIQSQVDEKREALAQLRAQAVRVRQEVLDLTQQLAAVGGDAAESAQRRRPGAEAQQQKQQQHTPAAAEADAPAAMEEG